VAIRCGESGNAAAHDTARLGMASFGATDWLCLAATPTFAIMTLLTSVGGGMPDMLCAAAHDASPLGGMAPMYVLMSVFHSPPWLKLVARRRK
jgi:hypothetical protein